MFSRTTLLISGAAMVAVTVLAIYLTPLKWVNIIEPSMHDIDPQEFYDDFSAHPDKYVFLDVRSAEVYARAHAQGSESYPIASLFDGHKSLPKHGKQIVLICTSGRLAAIAYGYLEHQGFLNLLRIEGGVRQWATAGLPLEGTDIYATLPEQD